MKEYLIVQEKIVRNLVKLDFSSYNERIENFPG